MPADPCLPPQFPWRPRHPRRVEMRAEGLFPHQFRWRPRHPRRVKTSAGSRVGRRGGVVLRGKIRIGPILILPFRTTPGGSCRAARCGLFSPQTSDTAIPFCVTLRRAPDPRARSRLSRRASLAHHAVSIAPASAALWEPRSAVAMPLTAPLLAAPDACPVLWSPMHKSGSVGRLFPASNRTSAAEPDGASIARGAPQRWLCLPVPPTGRSRRACPVLPSACGGTGAALPLCQGVTGLLL